MTSTTVKSVPGQKTSNSNSKSEEEGGQKDGIKESLRGKSFEEQEKALLPEPERAPKKPRGGGEAKDDRALARHILSSLAGGGDIDTSLVNPMAALIARFGLSKVQNESVGIKTTAAGACATTGKRLVSIVEHWCDGGSESDVLLGSAYAPGDDGAFATGLARLRTLRAHQPEGFDALSQEVMFAIIDEADRLGSAERATAAVALAAKADGYDTAKASLDENRAWGYRPELKQHAEEQGKQSEDKLVEERTKEIDDKTKLECDEAESDTTLGDEAFKDLSQKEQTIYGGKSSNVMNPQYRPSGVMHTKDRKNFESGKKAFDKKHSDLVGAKQKEITDKGELEKQDVVQKEGPQEKAKVVEEHRVFFESVGFHPDAATVLGLVQGDQGAARSIIDAIKAVPATRSIFIGNSLASQEAQRLIGLGSAQLGMMLTANITPTNLRAFGKSDNRIGVLTALRGGGVSAQRINGMAHLLDELASYVDNGGAPHFTTMCLAIDPAVMVTILNAMPSGGLAAAAAIRPHAVDVPSLLNVLGLCRTLGWKDGMVQTCLTGLPIGSLQAALRSAVASHHITRIDRIANFSKWLTAVGQLISTGFASISVDTDWNLLPEYPDAPTTYEKTWDVDVEGTSAGTYVVHYHPNISTKNGGSRCHFKSWSSADKKKNLDWAKAPDNVRARSEKSPPSMQ